MAQGTLELLKFLAQLPGASPDDAATKGDLQTVAQTVQLHETEINVLLKEQAALSHELLVLYVFGTVVLLLLVVAVGILAWQSWQMRRRLDAMEIDLLAAGIEAPSCHGVKA